MAKLSRESTEQMYNDGKKYIKAFLKDIKKKSKNFIKDLNRKGLMNEQIEVEEIYPEREREMELMNEEYIQRKKIYAQKILGELEEFTQCESTDWRPDKEEYEINDILSLVDNFIKAQLSAYVQNHE